MPNAITAVGTLVQSSTTTYPPTMSINPTAVGNMCCLTVFSAGNVSLSTVSGGHCTWARIAGPVYQSGIGATIELWMGVATATGAAAVTSTGITSGTTGFFMSQQFAGGGGPWAVDGTQAGTTLLATNSTSMTFKNLIPSGASRLYLGYGETTTATLSAVTSGYTKEQPSGIAGQAVIYDLSVSTSQTPVVTMGSAQYSTCAALIVAGSAGATFDPTKFMPFFM